MSAKLRLTSWITLMVLVLAGLALVFTPLINRASVTDGPAGRLVETVIKNAELVEAEPSDSAWSGRNSHQRGVYCVYYDADGAALKGSFPAGLTPELPFEGDRLRRFSVGSDEYYLYDRFVERPDGGLWIRGLVSAADRSGLRHTILLLTLTLLPVLLVLTVGGGWLIAWLSFRPIDNILSAADSISVGGDLSARLNWGQGPREIKRLGAAFDRMFARLELSFNAEKQFVSDASHELRTPITIILAECDRARRKAESREDFLASLDVIEEQGKRMSELTHQLLSLTRMQHGTDSYPLRPGDLSLFVDSCCSEFIPAEAKGIRLETDLTPGVQASFNSSLMSRVLQNLLQNAYKYGRENGTIQVTLRRDKRGAVLTVRDDGIGIAPEDQPKIWRRFWQSDDARGSDSGSGLGLAMVREIVLFHRGSVAVESEPGKGSTFTVVLP